MREMHLFTRFVFVLIPYCFALTHGDTVTETLVISTGLVSPDNYTQEGMLINGQFPGPTIYVNPNDTLIIQVENKLPSSFAMHFHGILQTGTIESDGVPWVTQDPIPSNSSYVYRINIGPQSGTFMYHAHTGLDLVWVFGALIIRNNPEHDLANHTEYGYDDEKIFLLSQCWHVPIQDIQAGLEGSPFQDVPDSSSILINGVSWGEWGNSFEVGGQNLSQNPADVTSNGFEVITVKPGDTYRFRVIGVGMDSMLTFAIEGHISLKVIEFDGILTDPVETDHLQLNSAQRYSILIKMDQPVENYWILSEMMPGPGPKNGRAILHYEGAPEPEDMIRQLFPGESEELELNHWILDQLHPSTILNQPVVYPVPEVIDREIVIRSFQRDLNGRTKFDINGIFHKNEGPTLLHEIQAGNDIISNLENGVYEILSGERIQIVFENRMSDEGECEQHPWHMHGHDFYIVGEGPDAYDTVKDRKAIDDKIANITSRTNVNITTKESRAEGFQFRDVVTLYPAQMAENNQSGAACGWTAVRFVADNPGLWLVHCHLTPHQIMGKHFVLYEHGVNGTLAKTKDSDRMNGTLINIVLPEPLGFFK